MIITKSMTREISTANFKEIQNKFIQEISILEDILHELDKN